MSITVMIPTALRRFAKDQATFQIEGKSNVGEVLAALTSEYGELKHHIYDGDKLRSFVNVYLNNEDIRYLDKDASAVKSGDTIMIVPSIAGGSAR